MFFKKLQVSVWASFFAPNAKKAHPKMIKLIVETAINNIAEG
jgi:hypothetical protein